MTITGTMHFVSFAAAVLYYKPYDADAAEVRRKVDAGEIHIGKPEAKPGERLHVIPGEGRYAIDTPDQPSGDVAQGDLSHVKAGDVVLYDGRMYTVQAATPAKSHKAWELDSLTMRDIRTNGLHTWSTGGHFAGLKVVTVSNEVSE